MKKCKKPIKNPEQYIAGKTADGRIVYHCLRWCNRILREFAFTLDPVAINGESRDELAGQIDARDVPKEFISEERSGQLGYQKYLPGKEPIDWVLAALNNGWEPETL
jgi:hypothetical protein